MPGRRSDSGAVGTTRASDASSLRNGTDDFIEGSCRTSRASAHAGLIGISSCRAPLATLDANGSDFVVV